MKNRGFTLAELISIIIILSVITILSFSSMTKTLKKTTVKELESFKDQIKNASSIYIESNINDYFNGINEETFSLETLINNKYLSDEISNPSNCDNTNIVIKATKNIDYTISYQVYCNNNETLEELEIE